MSKFDELLKNFGEPKKEATPEKDKPAILVIDDDESIRRGLSRILSHKYEVITAESGKKGVEVLSKDVHCVILDVKMKELNGFSTYPKLKDKSPDVPIIFYTAFQSEHDLVEVINKYRPAGYVEKGRDITFMENLIENAVHKYGLIIENEEYKHNLEEKVEERTAQYKKQKDRAEQALESERKERDARIEAEVQAAERRAEAELQKSLSGGLAHEARNASQPAAFQIETLSNYREGKSATDVLVESANKLDELIGQIGEDILSLKEKYNVPQHVIYEKILPQLEEIDAMSKDMSEASKRIGNAMPTITNSIGRGLALAKQFLEYSKLQEVVRGSTQINLSDVVNGVKNTYVSNFEELGIEYVTHVHDDEAVLVGDYLQIESVLKNLLLNAKDAVENNIQKKIEVSLINEGHCSQIIVEDNGEGISEENQAKIFNPFFSTKPSSGTGLGLNFVKRIVEAYGGKISVESIVGKGTKFYVDLPIK